MLPRDNMGREELFDDFNLKPSHYSAMAKKNRITLPTLMNRLSPESSPGYPQDAMGEILARHGLEISGNASYSSSSVQDFLDSDSELGPKETLFWATLDRDYDVASSIYDLERKMKLNAATSTNVGDSPEGGAVRPRSTRPLYELNKFRPPVSITDIAGGIETIPGQLWQVAEYATPAEDEYSTTIPEGGTIPLTTLTTSERQGRTRKVGAGLRVSLEAEMNSTIMSEVRMWVRRQGMRDEIKMVNEGVNLLKTAPPAITAVDLGTAASLGLSDILDVNMHFGAESGYILDTMVALKNTSKVWIEANNSSGASNKNDVRGGTPQRAAAAYGGIELINAGSGVIRLAYFDTANVNNPNVGVNLVERELIGFDSRWSLILYRQARGVTNENRYDPSSQVRDYFLTQRFGWHLQDASARVRFHWSA